MARTVSTLALVTPPVAGRVQHREYLSSRRCYLPAQREARLVHRTMHRSHACVGSAQNVTCRESNAVYLSALRPEPAPTPVRLACVWAEWRHETHAWLEAASGPICWLASACQSDRYTELNSEPPLAVHVLSDHSSTGVHRLRGRRLGCLQEQS